MLPSNCLVLPSPNMQKLFCHLQSHEQISVSLPRQIMNSYSNLLPFLNDHCPLDHLHLVKCLCSTANFFSPCCIPQGDLSFCINSFTASHSYSRVLLLAAFLFDLYWRWGKPAHAQLEKVTWINIGGCMLRQRLLARRLGSWEASFVRSLSFR